MFVPLILSAGLSLSAYAAESAVTATCEQSLSNQALTSENEFLAAIGGKIVDPEIYVHLWAGTKDGLFRARAWVSDLTDGRFVAYESAPISARAAQKCDFQLQRVNSTACRYGNPAFDNGLVSSIHKSEIKPDDSLSEIVTDQLLALFETDKPGDLPRLILNSDDGIVYREVYKFPGGVHVEQLKAYGGDNPFGLFFIQNQPKAIGTNADGDFCIGYEVEK